MQSATVPFIVFLTGGLGSVLRFVVGKWLNQPIATGGFPWGTLAVNLIGAFLIALLGTLLPHGEAKNHETIRVAVLSGLLGGFTTFSAIQYESILLMKSDPKLAWLYMGSTYVLGGLCAGFGLAIAHRLLGTTR